MKNPNNQPRHQHYFQRQVKESPYLGGLALTRFGDYSWTWVADIVLASAAAIVNLPIREAPVLKPAT